MPAPGQVCSCGRLRTPAPQGAWVCADHCDGIRPDGPCDPKRCPYCQQLAETIARREGRTP